MVEPRSVAGQNKRVATVPRRCLLRCRVHQLSAASCQVSQMIRSDARPARKPLGIVSCRPMPTFSLKSWHRLSARRIAGHRRQWPAPCQSGDAVRPTSPTQPRTCTGHLEVGVQFCDSFSECRRGLVLVHGGRLYVLVADDGLRHNIIVLRGVVTALLPYRQFYSSTPTLQPLAQRSPQVSGP
jgi:hypothetical protein